MEADVLFRAEESFIGVMDDILANDDAQSALFLLNRSME
jgi:hypothetical protein